MKTFEKISWQIRGITRLCVTLAIGLALITGFASCKPEVEYIEKPVEKEYAKAVTFDSTASEGKVTVTMKTETEDAGIYYTIDGKTIPSAESTKYTEALTCTEDTVIMAIAVKEGIENSPLSYAKVSITEKKIVEEKVVEKEVEKEVEKLVDKKYAGAVTYTVNETETSGQLSITMASATEGALIYYTTDGSVPTAQSTKYQAAITVTEDTVFNAIAVKEGVENSPISYAKVSIKEKRVVEEKLIEKNGDPLSIAISASPEKSNDRVTVTVVVTTSANDVTKVVYKKNGSTNAASLLADTDATIATPYAINCKYWTFDINATDETANGTYTIAVLDSTGREETKQIDINNFDFTPPAKVTGVSGSYENSQISLSWTDPEDTDFDHVAITYTYNDGTSDSTESEVVNVAKGEQTKTFDSIISSAKYYTFFIKSIDSLGNSSLVKKWNVAVSASVSNCPEEFVEVKGSTVTGGTKFALSGRSDDYYKGVFREGRTVEISDFYMCDHEVTQAEFQRVMGTNPSYFSSDPAAGETQEKRPVDSVNWYMAIAYCNKKSSAEGLTPCYTVSGITDWGTFAYSSIPTEDDSTWNSVTCNFSADGYRLPTEAEWEYAALGGKNGAQAENPTDYAGTDSSFELEKYAWYSSNSNDMTHEVKINKVADTDSANSLGLYDMSGNVWEWCWDCYDNNNTPSITSETPATGVSSGSYRVYRGGSYNKYNDASQCSVAYRGRFYPYYISIGEFGFRVVRTAN